MAKHPGFKSVQASIAKKSGVSKKAAGAILAASTRKASAGSKRANPRLKRVKMAEGGLMGARAGAFSPSRGGSSWSC